MIVKIRMPHSRAITTVSMMPRTTSRKTANKDCMASLLMSEKNIPRGRGRPLKPKSTTARRGGLATLYQSTLVANAIASSLIFKQRPQAIAYSRR